MQSPAPSKKTGSEFDALAISVLEAQCGSPGGNCHRPAAGSRSQRLKASFFTTHHPKEASQEEREGTGLKSFHSFSDESPSKSTPPPTRIQSSNSLSPCWVLDAAVRFAQCTVSSPPYQRAHGHAQGRLRQLYAKKSLGSSLN